MDEVTDISKLVEVVPGATKLKQFCVFVSGEIYP